MKKAKHLGPRRMAEAGSDPFATPILELLWGTGVHPQRLLDSKPGQSSTWLLATPRRHCCCTAAVCRAAGALPFFLMVSLQTRRLFAKPVALKTALQDTARPCLTRALEQAGMNSGSCRDFTTLGAIQSGSASPSKPAFIHQAQVSKEGPLISMDKSQPTLETSTSHCKHPQASASFARASSTSEHS